MKNSRFKMDFTRISNALARYCVAAKVCKMTNDFDINNILTRGIGPQSVIFFNENKEELIKEVNSKLEHYRSLTF